VLLPHFAQPVVFAVGAQPLLLLDGYLRRSRRRGSHHLHVLLLMLMMVVMSAGRHFRKRG